jgi:hypothetical protein
MDEENTECIQSTEKTECKRLPISYLGTTDICPRDPREASFVCVLDDVLEELKDIEDDRTETEEERIIFADCLMMNLDENDASHLLGSQEEWWCVIESILKEKEREKELCFLNEQEGDDFEMINSKDVHKLMIQEMEKYASSKYKQWCKSISYKALDKYHQMKIAQKSIDSSVSSLKRISFIDHHPWFQVVVSGYKTCMYVKGIYNVYKTINNIPTVVIPTSTAQISSFLLANLPSIVSVATTLFGFF